MVLEILKPFLFSIPLVVIFFTEFTNGFKLNLLEKKYKIFSNDGSAPVDTIMLVSIFFLFLIFFWWVEDYGVRALHAGLSRYGLFRVYKSKEFWSGFIPMAIYFGESLLGMMLYFELRNHLMYLWNIAILEGKNERLIDITHQTPRKFIVKYEAENVPVIVEPYDSLSNELPDKYKKLNGDRKIGEKGTYGIKVYPTARGPHHNLLWNSSGILIFHIVAIAVIASFPLWLPSRFCFTSAIFLWLTPPLGAIALSVWIWLFDLMVFNNALNQILFGDFLAHFKEYGLKSILRLRDYLKLKGEDQEVLSLSSFYGTLQQFLSIYKEQVLFDIFYLTPTTLNIYQGSMANVKYYAFEESNKFIIIPFDNISKIVFDGSTLKIETPEGSPYTYRAGTAIAQRMASALADRLREEYRLTHTQISTMNYEEALDYLDKLINYERRSMPKQPPDLNEFREFLAHIGNPHLHLRNPILIVGTKGKGSTAAHLAALIANMGYKVGLYTSPHLLQPLERIKIVSSGRGGVKFEDISVDEFASYIARVHRYMPRRGGMRTYFELITAIAFLYFNDRNVDYAVIEAGLGGKYDATNVIQQIMTIITPISYDHVHILGPRLENIVEQKVDVIKKHGEMPIINVVIGEQAPNPITSSGPANQEMVAQAEAEVPRTIVFKKVLRKIRSIWEREPDLLFRLGLLFESESAKGGIDEFSMHCEEELAGIPAKLREKLRVVAADYKYKELNSLYKNDPLIPATEFSFRYPYNSDDELILKTGLAGHYQAQNASLASLAVKVLGLPQKLGKQIGGLEYVTPSVLHGRFEIVRKYHPMMIVDGAHNAFAIKEFIKALSEYIQKIKPPEGNYGIFLVFGTNEDKDIEDMLKAILLSGLNIERIYFTNSQISRAENPHRLLHIAEHILNNTELKKRKRSIYRRMRAVEGAHRALDMAFDDAVDYERANEARKAIIVVVGSFYLAGEAIEWNYEFLVELPGKPKQ